MSTAPLRSEPQAPPRAVPAWRAWLPLAIILCGTFCWVLDFFIVNVALPAIQRGLGAGPAAVEWTVAGYGLATATVLVCGGRLGDRYGRRLWFSIGLGVFVGASALCALSPTPAALIAFRVVQGVGGGLMAPNILAILGVAYTGADRLRAITAYGIVMGVAAAGGQVLGGLLLHVDVLGLGWRLLFWVNVPIGLAALLLAPVFVPESRSEARGMLDLLGALLLAAMVVAVVLPLVDGRQAGWPVWSWACLAAAAPLAVLFVLHLRRAARAGRRPLLEPRVFAVAAFRTGLLVQLLFWCQQAAGYLVIALFLQEGHGLSPLASGGMFAVLAAGYVASSFPAPALTARFGRLVVGGGALLGAVGDVLLLLAAGHGGDAVPLIALAPGLLLLGAGQGFCITPLTSIVLAGADGETAGSVTGALSTTQQVGNAVGVAAIGVVFYGILGRGAGTAAAFAWSAATMGLLLLAVVGLSRLLPGRGVR